ncbi:alpha amylase C-terminal domain-containing protein [Desulfospira joergensenii]|uniref:alpha amylase C-terminal domain-containing protein n=1 Tax=Desulfospira joergensenii TaxID=53329 RepID=UPI0003B77C79|nr:alpha amylase C-terminal domain-containing protein [Desulfospira joergensenii]
MGKCLKDPFLSDSGIFNDPFLLPYKGVIRSRAEAARTTEEKILHENRGSLQSFADYHLFFGLHPGDGKWVFREWAPNAQEMFILCPKNGWEKNSDYRVPKRDGAVFEAWFPEDRFAHGDLYRLKIVWPGGEGDRIPTAATRVVQDPRTLIFNAQVWEPDSSFQWKAKDLPGLSETGQPLLIYETHAGMALEESRIGTWTEFRRHILPKIVHSGYNAIQLMAVQEHPYYGSFGYHVSSFFAPSSRFGTPEELKRLIDTAHENGIRVFMDMIHSHSVKNEVEGLSRFDGTLDQFFHSGPRGFHMLWDSRCFDYAKPMVIRFLLSNLRYWMEEFRMDGFRFDGITSMLYHDHGLGRSFTSYEDYFGPDVDTDALSYLFLANRLVHDIRSSGVTIAEDVSGYPGLAADCEKGGTGFDFRFSMGIADFWIRLLKEVRDEDWPLGSLWHELTTRRKEEATISYSECHDQALVGDKTLMMHLMGGHIYTGMEKSNKSIETVRAVALHKMIRLITLATANAGYLNFMGNEFGHPEWVDFPSQLNNFSYVYARRQWSLKYHPDLYYGDLFEFDRQMIDLAKSRNLFSGSGPDLLYLHEADKILAFRRSGLIFVFNFNPDRSFFDHPLDSSPGKYRSILDTDEPRFGGQNRLKKDQTHFTLHRSGEAGSGRLSLYLPSRAALVLEPAG